MAPEETEVQETEETPESTEGTEGTENTEEVVEDSSTETQAPRQQQPDYEGRVRALEEQNRRFQERNQYLEQTARLLEQQRQQQYQPQPQTPRRPDLAPELQELDRTLDPLLSRRLEDFGQRVAQPLTDTITRLYDDADSSKFEMYLMRNHPELFEQEGGLDRVFQDVDAVRRQAAQSYGQWLSRVDAFLYAQGIRDVQNRVKTRKEKKVTQVRDEAKRVQSVRAAGSGTGTPTSKKPMSSEISSIREKAQRGDRLTDAERAKYRDFVSGISF
jgi:hypothetical protein